MPARFALSLALAAAACGCASTGATLGSAAETAGEAANTAVAAARRAAAPPALTPLAATPQPIADPIGPRAAGSLWQAGARTFFDDQRAKRIGDILTVDIRIADRAEVTNSSSRSRTASTDVGVDNLLGFETSAGRLFPGGFDPANLIAADAASSANGTGTVNREEEVELTVAAVVVDILPNGNLVIAGRQEVRINAELRELTVGGVIRPEDIAADNTIRHDQIAEARISYGGRGQITAVQRPRLGQRVVDAISPW